MMIRRFATALLLLLVAWVAARPTVARGVEPLRLPEVLASTEGQYPPYLIALIERDVALGRLRQARGAFDTNLGARANFTPSGYYDGSVADVLLDQPLPFWGGNVFAGYRISSGFLADYDKDRTQSDGEIRAGIKLNLLRGGPIDKRRTDFWKARLDVEIAEPFIQRQYLDIIRNATRSYYNWVAQGLRLKLSEELLGVARQRETAIQKQVSEGATAPIVQTDNQRLVISRELSLVQARRRFEAASIELSLFHRDAEDQPIRSGRERLPAGFPSSVGQIGEGELPHVITEAFVRRPELRRIRLVQEKAKLDRRLARNDRLPNLDVYVAGSENFGNYPYKDRGTELDVGVEFRVPLQRNEAKGRLQVVDAELDRLAADEQFAREKIVAEIRDAWSAIGAAYEQISPTRRNVELASLLENAENERFRQGAVDLLALQIREQATFEARQLEVDAQAEFFRARAEYNMATAATLPAAKVPAAKDAAAKSETKRVLKAKR